MQPANHEHELFAARRIARVQELQLTVMAEIRVQGGAFRTMPPDGYLAFDKPNYARHSPRIPVPPSAAIRSSTG